ncbi:hypothetical protein E2C01_095312 [Portunus trituberculatus]|uniref:Uncharacterized protein n=1 Tax=Portunus trituberculatus TaxID=210409 RepID=A0A5B7K3W6_PORTR|nr:hypothetical protein [Portunus trituberculatus]
MEGRQKESGERQASTSKAAHSNKSRVCLVFPAGVPSTAASRRCSSHTPGQDAPFPAAAREGRQQHASTTDIAPSWKRVCHGGRERRRTRERSKEER